MDDIEFESDFKAKSESDGQFDKSSTINIGNALRRNIQGKKIRVNM